MILSVSRYNKPLYAPSLAPGSLLYGPTVHSLATLSLRLPFSFTFFAPFISLVQRSSLASLRGKEKETQRLALESQRLNRISFPQCERSILKARQHTHTQLNLLALQMATTTILTVAKLYSNIYVYVYITYKYIYIYIHVKIGRSPRVTRKTYRGCSARMSL